MKQVKNSDDARTAYKKRQDNIAEYIQRIQQNLAADAGQSNINWAHVGSLGHVEELLQQIDEFLG